MCTTEVSRRQLPLHLLVEQYSGVATGEHWGNIGGTLGEHWGNIGGTLGEHWGNTQMDVDGLEHLLREGSPPRKRHC